MITGTTRDSSGLARAFINGEGFRSHGAFYAEYGYGYLPNARNHSHETAAFREYIRDARSVHVIVSYATTIGVVADGRALILARKFSRTTTKHQGTLRHALAIAGIPVATI